MALVLIISTRMEKDKCIKAKVTEEKIFTKVEVSILFAHIPKPPKATPLY